MSIRFSCPECSAERTLDDDVAGKKIRCPKCKAVVAVPARRKRGAKEEEIADAIPVSEGISPVWIFGGVGILAGLAAVVLLIVAMSRSGTPKPGPEPVANNNPNRPQPIPPIPVPNPVPNPNPNPNPIPVPTPQPPRIFWTAQPDPLPADAVLPDNLKGAITITGASHYPTLPSTPSAFVCVPARIGNVDGSEVWDLATGKRVGGITGLAPLADPVLSPDGQFLASRMLGGGGLNIGVWNVADGSSTKVVIDTRAGTVADLDFVGPEHLLVAKNSGLERSYQLREIKTSAQVWEFKDAIHADRRLRALSPTRKYLASTTMTNDIVRVYDLATGKIVGALPVSPPVVCNGLAFSPDGKSLAGLFDNRVVVWDTTTGKSSLDKIMPKSPSPGLSTSGVYRGQAVDWLPDSSGLVFYGQIFVDPQSGGEYWRLAETVTDRDARRFLPGGRFTAVRRGASRQMVIDTLPMDRMVTARDAVRAGKDPSATTLPPVKPGDWSQVKTLPAPVGNTAWKATADPAPASKGKLGARQMPLTANSEALQVLFTPPDIGQGVVVAATPIEGQRDRKQLRAERFDLVGGQHQGGLDLFAVEIPANRPFELTADVSPDGAMLATVESKDGRRVDFWSLTDSKHVAGWLPHDKEADGAIRWLGFVDAKRLLTLSKAGKLTLWDVPECKAVYSIGIGRDVATFSPGRKFVAIAAGSAIEVLEAATGERVGQLSGPASGRIEALAYRLDGRDVAALALSGVERSILRWDATTGASKAETPTTEGGTHLQWCGTDQVLVGSPGGLLTLVDCTLKWSLARYGVPGVGRVMTGSPDGRLWFAASTTQNLPPAMAAQTVPDEGTRQFAQLVAGGKVEKVLAPGMSMTVRLEGAQPPADAEGFAKSIVDQHAQSWQRQGYKIVMDNADVTFVVQINQRATGVNREYEFINIGGRVMGMKPPIISVPEQEISGEMSLRDKTGQVLWTDKIQPVRTPNPGGLIETNDLPGLLNKQLWNSVAAGAARTTISPPGVMMRTPTGLQPLPRSVTLTGDR